MISRLNKSCFPLVIQNCCLIFDCRAYIYILKQYISTSEIESSKWCLMVFWSCQPSCFYDARSSHHGSWKGMWTLWLILTSISSGLQRQNTDQPPQPLQQKVKPNFLWSPNTPFRFEAIVSQMHITGFYFVQSGTTAFYSKGIALSSNHYVE